MWSGSGNRTACRSRSEDAVRVGESPAGTVGLRKLRCCLRVGNVGPGCRGHDGSRHVHEACGRVGAWTKLRRLRNDRGALERREDGVAIRRGVVQALQNQNHRGV